jgi:zinc transport system substrate-binding protein
VISRIVLILVVVVAVTGCGAGGTGAKKGQTTVIAAFYPLAFAAERIGGTRVHVENLTPPGAEPHGSRLPMSSST